MPKVTEAELAAALEKLYRAVWPFRFALNPGVMIACNEARNLLEQYAEQERIRQLVVAKAAGKGK